MRLHEGDKVVPPADVVDEEAAQRLTSHVRAGITERVLREAGIEEQVASAVEALSIPPGSDLIAAMRVWLEAHPDRLWSEYVDEAMQELIGDRTVPAS
jgi:hypothetical protein